MDVKAYISPWRKEKDDRIECFSKKMGVDFAGYIIRRELYDDFDNHGYEASYPIDDVFEKLGITSQDSVVDLGCGKGYAMHLLRKYPFRRIDGVEKNHYLASIAKKNMSILYPNDDSIRVFENDVIYWNDYDNYNYYYMFNPFGGKIFETVLKRIIESANRRNCSVYIVYQLGEFHEKVLEYGFEMILKIYGNSVYKYN